ncbi:MAG TPA: ADOP family duplicated permease [Acidobacteriota bacterium]|nr:ADOP family duplicated permease [Acidobacteriota bacterium]
MARSRLSQNRWAQRMGLSSGHLSLLANGHRPYPGARTRERLLKALDCSFDDLFEVDSQGQAAKPETRPFQGDSAVTTLWQDFRFAFRFLTRQKTFAALSIIALAVGIGATTAIYSIVSSVLLTPPPYRSPATLVDFFAPGAWSRIEIARMQEFGTAFENITGFGTRSATLTGRDEPLLVTSVVATGNLFDTLGVGALHGRTFQSENSYGGRHRVVVVSHRFWTSVLGGVELARGTTLEIEGESRQLLGVMPPDFFFPRRDVDLWLPMEMDPDHPQYSGWHSWRLVGRLAQGLTLEEAQSSLDSLAASMREVFNYPPQWDKFANNPRLTELQQAQTGPFRNTLYLLLAAVSAVLLIACVNVTNLSLSRISSRVRELSIRRALGAGTVRIVRQILVENFWISLWGGLAGLLLAWLLVEWFAPSLPRQLLNRANVEMSWGVLLFGLALALLTVLLSGALPALQAARQDPQQGLAEGGRGNSENRTTRRWGSVLVVSEIALGVLLVVTAGLLLRSFYNLASVDPGLDPDQVIVFNTYPNSSSFTPYENRPRFLDAVVENLRALPGVDQVGAIQNLPLDSFGWIQNVTLEGESQDYSVAWRIIEGEYFTSMGIPLLTGRPFDGGDRKESQPVVIVNQAFVDRFWTGKDPLAQRLRVGADGEHWMPVVGVVGNVRQLGLGRESQPMVYRPYRQNPLSVFMSVTVRSQRDLASLHRDIQNSVWSVDADAPVFGQRTMNQVIDESLARGRLLMTLLVAFAAVALLLAVIGVYGVISYRVNQRFFEVGVRMALGASRISVVTMILRQGLALALLGLALGLAAAVSCSWVLQGMLHGISTTDPASYLAVSLLVLLVAVGACLFPALRAASWDPNQALRSE